MPEQEFVRGIKRTFASLVALTGLLTVCIYMFFAFAYPVEVTQAVEAKAGPQIEGGPIENSSKPSRNSDGLAAIEARIKKNDGIVVAIQAAVAVFVAMLLAGGIAILRKYDAALETDERLRATCLTLSLAVVVSACVVILSMYVALAHGVFELAQLKTPELQPIWPLAVADGVSAIVAIAAIRVLLRLPRQLREFVGNQSSTS